MTRRTTYNRKFTKRDSEIWRFPSENNDAIDYKANARIRKIDLTLGNLRRDLFNGYCFVSQSRIIVII
jgi:hypothetical protein